MRRVPLVLMFVVSSAVAQPKPAPVKKVPTRPVPCAMADLSVFAVGDDPVVCWDTGCMKLDLTRAEAAMHAKPPAAKWTIPQAEYKDGKVCQGAKCNPLGKKLTKAIEDHAKELEGGTKPEFHVTADLKLIAWGQGELWSVPGDRKIKATPPAAQYRRTGEKPVIVGTRPVGDLMVLQWSACAGPCTKFSIIDSAGNAKGASGEGGGQTFQLDAKRFVIVSEYSKVSVIEFGTGKLHSSFDLRGQPHMVDGARIDDDNAFILNNTYTGYTVYKVSLPSDKKLTTGSELSMFLPSCTP